MKTKLLAALAATAAAAAAQTPFHAESTSRIGFSVKGDEKKISTHNVIYQHAARHAPGKSEDQWLTLRVTTDSEEVIGDIPEPGTVIIEAWPLGVDPKQKPLYSVKSGGSEARMLDDALWVVDRGFVDVPMWSVFKLGTGQHLFDTHAELVRFSITRDVQTLRYVGLDVPSDDEKDARLKEPHVIAVISYASEDKVIRELLLTHTNATKAAELRSYADNMFRLGFVESPSKRLRIAFAPGMGGAATEIWVPLKGDDLDTAAARLPAGMSIKPWKR